MTIWGYFSSCFKRRGVDAPTKNVLWAQLFFQPRQHVLQQGLHAQFMIIRSGELRNPGVGEVRGDTLATLTAPHRAFAVSCD